MTDLDKLREQVVAFRDERNWKQFHNPKDMAISLVLEATELLEHFQWKTEAEFEAHFKQRREAVEDELVDILYWVLLMAHDLDVDLARAQARKMIKNARKYPVEKAKNSHRKYSEL